MIRIMIKSSILALSLLLSGCGGDNAFDGSGLIGGGAEVKSDVFTSLQKEVLTLNANELLTSLAQLKSQIKAFDANVTSNDVSAMQRNFITIMQEWKSVESVFVAGDYNRDLARSARLFDFYRTGKRLNVASDVASALKKNSPIDQALYLNSSKSITALEYLLFGANETEDNLVMAMNIDSNRRVDALNVTIDNLMNISKEIHDFYKNDAKFVANSLDASNALVNALVDSAFRLKEHRIGDSAGISVKFKGNPDPSRFEYEKSRLSLEAMIAILTTHQDIMGKRSYDNFGSFASKNGASEIVTQIQKKIQSALTQLNAFSNPIEESITKISVDTKVQTLYDTIKTLQELYFASLIQALDLTAEIIEADGD